MREKLNPEKSRKLRPLRVVLAVLIAILIVLVLDRLPTSIKDRPVSQDSSEQSNSGAPAPEGSSYYYFYDLLDLLEEQTEDRLRALGVPEEEYQNIAEYLSKDEMLELEAKATLAANLESTYALANEADIAKLQDLLNLSTDYIAEKYERPSATPAEYKNLSDLLTEYDKTINTTEDYDVAE